MSLTRCRLLLQNHTLNADSVTTTVSPPAGYEAANLQDPDRTKICKVAGNSVTVTINTESQPWVQALAMTGLLYDVGATFVLLGNDTNSGWSVPLFSSGVQEAYPPAMPMGSAPMGAGVMGGYLTSATNPFYRPSRIWYLPELGTYKWWRVIITNSSTASETGISVLGLCTVVEMQRNFTERWSIAPIETNHVKETTGGQWRSGQPRNLFYQELTLPFRSIPEENAWQLFHDALKVGTGAPFFIDPFPDVVGGRGDQCRLYGGLKNLPPMPRGRGYQTYDYKLTMREQAG